jgi:serine phosphatase RsbU (regulator of sigma subunit)
MNKVKRYKLNLSIRFKIILIIFFTVIFSLISYLINRNLIQKAAAIYEKEQQSENKTLVKALFKAKTEFVDKTNTDYRYYDWMVNFINHPDTAEAKKYISSPNLLGIDLFGVYNRQGIQIYKQNSSSQKNLNFITNPNFFKTLYRKKNLNFYSISPDGLLMYVVASTIHNSLDTICKTNPKGYLIVAIVYDRNFLKKIEDQINCSITTEIHGSHKVTSPKPDIPLFSYTGAEIGKISVNKNSDLLSDVKKLNKKSEWIFILSMIVICLITIIAYNYLVLHPLVIIQSALNKQSDKIARKLMYKSDEFGKISRLIVRFFQQRKLLDEKLNKLSETGKKLKSLNKELSETAKDLLTANDEIKVWQKNTTDNIYYASAVQRAALIPSFEIDTIFREHLIIFKPRDIISGDFYWFYQHHDKYYVATADCTGHGLSGSLMSMLGISFLNQIIHQSDENINAAQILEKLRKFIVGSLHQQGSSIEVYDGIDIGICVFDFSSMTMEYAAAYNPLYLIRYNKTTQAYELNIYKGDSMPAGIYEKQNNFSNYTIALQPDDLLYLFTDGYVDQFGGPDNKKFLTKNLKELLLSIAHLPLTEQKELIINTFEQWKGNTFQVDDVTMVGLKIYIKED